MLNMSVKAELKKLNRTLRKYKLANDLYTIAHIEAIVVSLTASIVWFTLKMHNIKIFDFGYILISLLATVTPSIVCGYRLNKIRTKQGIAKEAHLKEFREKVFPKIYTGWSYNYIVNDINSIKEITSSKFCNGANNIDFLGHLSNRLIQLYEIVITRNEYTTQGILITIPLQSFSNINELYGLVQSKNTKGYTYTDIGNNNLLILCTGLSFDKFMGYKNGVYTYETISIQEFKNNYKIIKSIISICEERIGG